MHEDTVHLLAGQKRLEDEYKNLDVLHMFNKAENKLNHIVVA